jgi:hypothetical protein
MSLKTAMQQAAKAAFRATTDLQNEVSVKIRSDTYSVATGAVTNSDTSNTVKVLFTRYTDQERLNNAEIMIEDYRVLFPAKDTTFTPSTQDIVTKGTDDYEILAVSLDSAQAMYSLQVRKQ